MFQDEGRPGPVFACRFGRAILALRASRVRFTEFFEEIKDSKVVQWRNEATTIRSSHGEGILKHQREISRSENWKCQKPEITKVCGLIWY